MPEEAHELRLEILAEVKTEINSIRYLEESGYTLSEHRYMKGQAYWWFTYYGSQRVTVMHTNTKPLYPEGDWHLALTTMNGEIDHDNTISTACNILAINSQEKHGL